MQIPCSRCKITEKIIPGDHHYRIPAITGNHQQSPAITGNQYTHIISDPKEKKAVPVSG